ncbi:XRE family transcriptional regulator [Streptomyces sp. NPDC048297]|uniref:XRE family transcriptional regulator n=1 Tax=Streptomyces sp. NPDC048297 TaxID=3365531 RepID=UPI00371D6EE6
MPRWNALPDELDPQIKEFTGLLRRLVDRVGLNAATLAARTGYSESSWEHYLNGRLLAPKAAVIALAEVTGTSPVHLTTLWELAERAWNRAQAQAQTQTHPRSQAAGGDSGSGGSGRRRLTMVLAGLGGVLVIVAGVFVFTYHGGRDGRERAKPSPSAAVRTHVKLPAGVRCAGSACTGKDAEAMGCGGDLVTTAKTATVGTVTLEVRYSRVCGAAWGRITGAASGDRVEVTVGTVRQAGDITAGGDTVAYTPMVAVKDASAARACAILASGRTGCTN